MDENSKLKLQRYYQVSMDKITKQLNLKAKEVGERFSKKELDRLFKDLFFEQNPGIETSTSKMDYDTLSVFVEFCLDKAITVFEINPELFNQNKS
jgi:hypothetical protein